MAVTNYSSEAFYVGVNSEGYFADRRHDQNRRVYHYIHTPAIEEAEVFCDTNAGFLEEHGYSRVAVNVQDYQHKHFYPFWVAKNPGLAS